jgi:hypothetical protein
MNQVAEKNLLITVKPLSIDLIIKSPFYKKFASFDVHNHDTLRELNLGCLIINFYTKLKAFNDLTDILAMFSENDLIGLDVIDGVNLTVDQFVIFKAIFNASVESTKKTESSLETIDK